MLKLGSIIAWILIAYGLLRVALGFFVAFRFSAEDNAAAAGRYLAGANSGEAINEGMVMFVVGVVIGILVKIAEKKSTSEET